MKTSKKAQEEKKEDDKKDSSEESLDEEPKVDVQPEARAAEKSMSSKNILIIAIVVAVLIAAVPSYYFYSQYQKTQKLLQNPTQAAQEEVKALVDKVSALIELPKGEVPTVATVSDKNKLKDQPFFAQAENGDKVLIYTKARKAILYRPSTNKVIEVGPVNIGSTQTQPQAQSTPQPLPVKIAIYNGTKVAGFAASAEKQLKEHLSDTSIEVVVKENAKNDYKKTVVVALSESQKQVAGTIAQLLGGELGDLPQTEAKPQADIVVILGK